MGAGEIQLATAILNIFFQYCKQVGMTEEEKEAFYNEERAKFLSRDADDLPTS